MYELRNWYNLTRTSQKEFPGKRITQIDGQVFNHPKYEDGHGITTSPVTHIDKEKRIITTHTGSKYLLGESFEDISLIEVLENES